MSQATTTAITEAPDEVTVKNTLGFWIYLMTDCVLFATLFATYAVLRNNTFGGPAGHELFSLPFVLTETLLLLTSSFSCGLAIVGAQYNNRKLVLAGLFITLLLGMAFLGMELSEFSHLVNEGNSWRRSGFLSSFFTLVGTHGLHITAGLLWIIVTMVQIGRRGLTVATRRRLTLLSLFWHFLDIVWIFIFTIVYLLGSV